MRQKPRRCQVRSSNCNQMCNYNHLQPPRLFLVGKEKKGDKLLGRIADILQKYLSVAALIRVFYCIWDADCVLCTTWTGTEVSVFYKLIIAWTRTLNEEKGVYWFPSSSLLRPIERARFFPLLRKWEGGKEKKNLNRLLTRFICLSFWGHNVHSSWHIVSWAVPGGKKKKTLIHPVKAILLAFALQTPVEGFMGSF